MSNLPLGLPGVDEQPNPVRRPQQVSSWAPPSYAPSPQIIPPTPPTLAGTLIVMPVWISIHDWAASLITDMPQDFVPQLTSKRHWREWASVVAELPTASRHGAPNPQGYPNWRSWAIDFYSAVNGQPGLS